MVRSECDTPKVWMGSLAAYNAGKLHGEWIDLGEGVDAFGEACAEILRTSPEPGEELQGFDTEGLGGREVGPGEARQVAEWFDEGGDTWEWAARMVAFEGDIAQASDPSMEPDDMPIGPYDYMSEAEDGADEWIRDVFHEAIAAIEKMRDGGMYYVDFDYEQARKDLFSFDQVDGQWWATPR